MVVSVELNLASRRSIAMLLALTNPLESAAAGMALVPVHVNLPGILLADVAAFAGILLLLLIPTLFISKVDPAKTVKAE